MYNIQSTDQRNPSVTFAKYDQYMRSMRMADYMLLKTLPLEKKTNVFH